MLKSSIILVLLAVAASCDKITDQFHTIGSYERAGRASKTWYLSTWTTTWSEAVEECKSHGMKLATFGTNKKETDELLNLYSSSSTNPNAFIGYTDKELEGTFSTFEGKKLQIDLNFHTNEPNNLGGDEDCLELKKLNDAVKYNDVDCKIKQQFICELESFIRIGSYEKAGGTSKSWYLSTWSSTWSNAVKKCKSYGMKLATFGSDKQEADELLNLYSASSTHPDAFIGYTDKKKEGTFSTFKGEKLQIELNFHTNEPNSYGGDEDCLELYNLNNEVKYNDVDCNSIKKFMCEFENNCQSCDRVNKDNIRIQNALSEAELNLQHKDGLLNEAKINLHRKDELLSVEKSKREELVEKLQTDLSESNLNLQLTDRLLFDADKNLKLTDRLLNYANKNLQLKDRLLDDADKNLKLKDIFLNYANKNLQRKNELLNVEKSKNEELLKKLQNDFYGSNLNLQLKDRLLDDADKSLKLKDSLLNYANKNLQLKDSLLDDAYRKDSFLEDEKSRHKEAIKQLNNEIKILKQNILHQSIVERINL